MSRSRRRPFAFITGVRSQADDKKIASRIFRRASRQRMAAVDFPGDENFLLPSRRECGHNDPWTWAGDGERYLVNPEPRRLWADQDWYRRWCGKVRRK